MVAGSQGRALPTISNAPVEARRPSASGRLLRAIVLILLGMAVTGGAAASDAYLHRGAMDGGDVVYRQPVGQALATNVDLRNLSDNALQSEINILKSAGYQYLRQDMYWSDIEPQPGAYNWDQYKSIVGAVTAANMVPVLVLRGTPIWARAPEQVNALDAPPILPEMFQTFCATLRSVFPSLRFFQIGANLDDPAYWGNQPIDVIRYASMLKAASIGLNVSANDSILIGGEIGVNPDLRAKGEDLETIRRLLVNPDIRGIMRVLAVTVDGGQSSPYDRSAAPDKDNLSRAVLVREAVDSTGATTLPIWFTHFGWTGSGSPISADQQAAFVTTGLGRIRDEWPWAGLVFNWDFGNSPDLPAAANLPLMINGESTPLMKAMTAFGNSVLGNSITNGFVPPVTDACTYAGNWQDQHLADGVYRITSDPTATVTCQFWGTGFSTFFRFSPDSGTVRYVIDQPSLPPVGSGSDVGNVYLTWQVDAAFEAPVELASGLEAGPHTVTMGLADSNQVVIGGFLVKRERPMIWPIAVLVAAGLVALFLGLRNIAFLCAEMVGLIDNSPDQSAQNALPTLPNWAPSPRLRRQD